MSGFGVAETQIIFWPTSIVMTLLFMAFSIWILGYRFVRKLFTKQPTSEKPSSSWPLGEASQLSAKVLDAV
jgi:hypothetical protein